MSEEEVEVVAHQIALEICEATAAQARQWVWPDDFTGDTIDRARCRAEIIIAALDNHREASERNGNRPQLTCDERMQMESRRRGLGRP